MRDAFASRGREANQSLSVARFAALSSFTCISSANTSRASSIADASRCRTTEVSSAVRFGSGVR